jgi:hypothetical protein
MKGATPQSREVVKREIMKLDNKFGPFVLEEI